jgi:zinc D-Ala-D-Ala carboxypeptidase
MRMRSLGGAVAAVLLAMTAVVAVSTLTAGSASADGCFTWNRTLRPGMSGGDVKQLQIRVAGWVGSGEVLAIDGQFGSRTAEAVKRFKRAYGIDSTSGTAGSAVFNKLYQLQDADCTPIHFTYSEFNYNCGARNFNGGKVSASAAKENIRRIMWQLEALRHKLGNRPLVISSGFRSVSCNASVGGSSTSLHMYGRAVDLGTGSAPSLCAMAEKARSSGFREILGPGYPGHGDHTHVGNKSTRFWSAPNCGI